MIQEAKTMIRYHRSYRKLPGSIQRCFVQFLFLVMPLSVFTVFFYSEMTRAVCRIATFILAPLFFSDTIRIIEMPYIHHLGNVSFLALPGQFPTVWFTTANAFICLLLLVLLPRIERAKPLIIFLMMLSYIHLAASLFFLIRPGLFPYDAVDYSQLYMLQQIGIWFFIPLILGLAIMPLPSGLTAKGFTMVTTYLYSLLFGTVRYVVFLFILTKVSLLYMPILFFALGPLIDFIYVVSIHVTRLANKLAGDFTLWKW